jgi:hypothetical protein
MSVGGWWKGRLVGSLREIVAREIAQHRRTNPALIDARPPLRMRVLQAALGERGLLRILVSYALLVIALLLLEVILTTRYPAQIPSWANAPDLDTFLKDIASYFLAAQVTVIGLLFPIAVALVTLIVQREDASSTNSDVQVYYNETLAYRVGASGIALSIILAVQLFWPAQAFALRLGFGIPTGLFKTLLTVFHLVWLVANLAALWHFLVTSLSFMRPVERALLRRRFAANVAIPIDLAERLMMALYMNAATRILQRQNAVHDEEDPTVLFGADLGEWGEVEIASPRAVNKVLHDVWMKPLGWAVRRWLERCTRMPNDEQRRDSRPSLIFVPDLRRPLHEPGVVCRRRNGVPLDGLEKFVIRQCFRFRRDER